MTPIKPQAAHPLRPARPDSRTPARQSHSGGDGSSRPTGGRFHRTSNFRGPRKTTEQKVEMPRPQAKGVLRVVPLGGVEEIGRNMSFLEYGDDIIIIDMGLQFPEENMPGIDYVIPNVSYLKEKKKNIRGVIITHGHFDHIGAIPYLSADLGAPTIYAMPLTRGIILKRQQDFKHLPPLNVEGITKDTKLKLGVFSIEFFHVNHNIFDTVGVAIRTPVGVVCHTADFKFDDYPVGDIPADYEKMKRIGNEGVALLLSDSTGAMKAGHSISERDIEANLEEIFVLSKGRIICATFSSLISRLQQLIHLAEKYDRKVAIDGFSMKSNVALAQELGYLKIPKGVMIDVKNINDYEDNKILFLCTGAQGEGGAVLMRVATQEHRYVRLKEGDTVVFSSSVVPGNERTVQSLKDIIYRADAEVYHYQMMDIHAGGHAQEEDLTEMMALMKPKFFMPIHGNYYMLKLHGRIAERFGIPKSNIVIPENGAILELTRDKFVMTKEKVPSNYVFVDGLGVGDIKEVVLRDRQMMASDGMFVIIAVVDAQTGKLKGSPDLISRGFVYLKESGSLLHETRGRTKKIIEEITSNMHPVNFQYVKEELREKIGQFLFQRTERRPMVIPVVIEV
ncbi:MAG: ribonuclease J [Patescibacteria group bacterium]